MKVLNVVNVNQAVAEGIDYLVDHGIEEKSRNGTVLVAPGPVTTIYRKPTQRVLFSPLRDANPFFHLMESLWMLAGRNDLEFPKMFNSRFGAYSDDGRTIWGAYGWRWREFFGYDQIEEIIKELVKNPTSRRCVLSMWNGYNDDRSDFPSDLHVAAKGGKDVPCNTQAYFDLRGGKLNVTVCNRSNDIIWGAYGANAVHFSILQEYMATCIGVEVGLYYQVSNNYHAYTDIYDRQKLIEIANEAAVTNIYLTNPLLKHVPIMSQPPKIWEQDLHNFFDRSRVTHKDDFFKYVVEPMYLAFMIRKEGGYIQALELLSQMPNCDWRLASENWIRRREGKKNAA